MRIVYLVVIPLDYAFAEAQIFDTEQAAKDFLRDEKENGTDISYAMLREVEV
jgi:hypothetical protein